MESVSGNRVFLSCVYMCTAEPLVTNLVRRRIRFWQRGQVLFYNGLCSTTSTETTTQRWETLKLMKLSPSSQLPITGSILITTRLTHLGELKERNTKISSVDSK